MTSTSGVEARTDNRNGDPDDDNFVYLRERADVTAGVDAWSTQLRLDGVWFPAYVTVAEQRAHATVERAAVVYAPGPLGFVDDLAITVGDAPLFLGRGVVLALRPVDAIGSDTALRGARVDVSMGPVSALAGAGVANPVNVDPVSLHDVADPYDAVAGSELRFTLAHGLAIGAVGSIVAPRERLLPDEQDGTASAGAYASWSPALSAVAGAPALSLALEADVQQRMLAGTFAHGGAVTADATASYGAVTLALEALWLGNWQVRGSENTATGARFDYAQPPTLERIDQEVQSTSDVGATRARVDVETPIATVFASALGKIGSPWIEGAEVPQAHVFVGADRTFDGGSHLGLTVGARDERLGLTKLAPLKRMAHVDVDALLALDHGFALHASSTTQLWDARGNVFARGSTLLAMERASVGSVGVELGVDTQDPSPDVRRFFLASVVAWKPTSWLELRAVGGSQRGGTKCMAGVCREWPSFSGAKIDLIVAQ